MKHLSTPARLIRNAFLLLICAEPGTVPAQQTQVLQSYDVEVVIFRHLSTSATPEQWGMEAAEANQRLAIPDEEPSPFATQEDTAVPPPVVSFPALPASRYKLTAIEETLRRSRNYRPLAHLGWTQPGFPRNDAKSLSVSAMVPTASGVAGQIALSRGRYLHLTLELVFEPPDEPGQRFVLRQTRRMRSNERHYFDHPRFGVIVVIAPAEVISD